MVTSAPSDRAMMAGPSPDPSADPFVSHPSTTPQRFSHFDSQLFATGAGASAEQAKRALQSHLAETERRMAEAGKLGTALVQQQKELADRLKEVEDLETEEELSPELKQRLSAIEKDFQEVARDSARAFLPKQRIPSNETTASGSPHPPESRAGRRSVSPSKLERQAVDSPTKLSVPNRKVRNQSSGRVHDIEFAAEISTSLIAQVRNLQQLLAERDEELKDLKSEHFKLEGEAENLQQRMRNLDDSEHRYKDENWNLETQIHELIAAEKDASDREKKLVQSLAVLQAHKNATQKELDEIKLSHGKLTDDHAAAVKHHDIELGAAKRNAAAAESERTALQRKIDELTSQNQELARAWAAQRNASLEQIPLAGMMQDDMDSSPDQATPDHSPPISPVKHTPRHSMLESETMRTSLQHAQRMMQSMRTNVHREKTEKLELKRLLQDARDELEKLRADASMQQPKKNRKMESREFKKPKRSQLGSARTSRSEIIADDAEWEDQSEIHSLAPRSPSRRPTSSRGLGLAQSIEPISEDTDQFDTANENTGSDTGFESARERVTGTDDFHTGAEEFSGDDSATETDTPSKPPNSLRRPPLLSSRYTFESTASSSDSDDDNLTSGTRTPTHGSTTRYRRVSRGGLSRPSREVSEEPEMPSSPASYTTAEGSRRPGQSLFAELGDIDGSEADSVPSTPGGQSIRSMPMTPGSLRGRTVTPPPQVPSIPAMPALPKVVMVDSGMVTDPVQVQAQPEAVGSLDDGVASVHSSTESTSTAVMADNDDGASATSTTAAAAAGAAGAAATAALAANDAQDTEDASTRPISTYSDAGAQWDPEMESKLGQFPTPPQIGSIPAPILPPPQNLSYSSMSVQHVEPVSEPDTPVATPKLNISSVRSEHIEPQEEPEEEAPVVLPPPLSMAAIQAQSIEPKSEPEPPIPAQPVWTLSKIQGEQVEPVEQPVEEESQLPTPVVPVLSYSSIGTQHVEPVEEEEQEHKEPETDLKPQIAVVELSLSPIVTQNDIEPSPEQTVVADAPEPPKLALSNIQAQHVKPTPEPEAPTPQFTVSHIASEHVEPVEPAAQRGLAQSDSLASVLTYSSIQSIGMEPRSPRRNGFIIPRDEEFDTMYETPKTPARGGSGLGLADSRSSTAAGKTTTTPTTATPAPVIAEDETRQSPSHSPEAEKLPESERPFKEISANSISKPGRKAAAPMSDQSAQTSLTSDAIDRIIKTGPRTGVGAAYRPKADSFTSSVGDIPTPGTVRHYRSQESVESVLRLKPKSAGVDEHDSTRGRPDTATTATTATSGQGSTQTMPPLPSNFREAIETQRSGSAQGSHGTMGPPMLSASAMRSQNAGGRAPSSTRPMSPLSSRAAPANRAPSRLGSSQSNADAYAPPSMPSARSRRSSVSSFASEVDARFNQPGAFGIDPTGFGPNTDPRMIQAITQTMIGEYMWKYTRKTGRGELSGNRHRRYFWVHPYTRTLYWSDRDPSTAGRSELRAKSVPIEAVRVVTDDNPMPPGLHRKSLIVVAPGRSIKFTCTTGQRHETWFNALSYLLVRTNENGHHDTEEMVGNIARDDLEEYSPPYGHQSAQGHRSRGPPSMSSHNSRTKRNASPALGVSMNVPTLKPSPKNANGKGNRQPSGTFNRFSSYWRQSSMGPLRTQRSQSALGYRTSGFENSEAHDSAEELRAMYEQQDREADRLENVRACCEGKHDVGTLTRGRRGLHHHHHAHAHSDHRSASQTFLSSVRSKVH